MLYSGDEDYGDEITSPLSRELPAYIPTTQTPRRTQVRKVKRAMAKGRDVYAEFADLYDIPADVSNDAEDRYNRGGW